MSRQLEVKWVERNADPIYTREALEATLLRFGELTVADVLNDLGLLTLEIHTDWCHIEIRADTPPC